MLHMQLLGGFHLQIDADTVTTLTLPRLQSLLAYLVLHRQTPLLRQQLAFLFWPDSTEGQARTNLRHALHNLRQVLPNLDSYLEVQTQWVQWRPSGDFHLDVGEFEEASAQAEQLIQRQQLNLAEQSLNRAVELYKGPFLPNCYEEWVLTKREELAQRYRQSLAWLINLHEKRLDLPAAIAFAQRLLRHDPLAETTYQHLMRLHALSGDRAGALRIYHECVAMLERELGVEPSAETRSAYSQLFNELLVAAPPTRPPVRTGDTPLLIGREVEWQQLLALWQRASQGHAQVVALTGEVGIGKTRLAETLTNWVSRQGLRAATARLYEAEGTPAYAPLIDLLRSNMVLANLPQLSDLWLAQVARLLPEVREQYPHLAQADLVNNVGERQHFYEAMAHAVLGKGDALLLVIDDLQWCDRESLEWLRFLLRFVPQARLLLVVTVRSGEVGQDHPLHTLLLTLRSEHRLTEIVLGRLSRADSDALATHVAGRDLPTEQMAELYRQTAGNPLFVVETMRAAISHWATGGDGEVAADFPLSLKAEESASILPDRVKAVIEIRIIQLTALAQEVAGHAAVLGGPFSIELLAHIGSFGEDDLMRAMDELWQRHILREQGSHNYDFSHPQIREVVYLRLSPMRRRLLHRRAAQALERHLGDQLESQLAVVATHYEIGGDAAHALHAYQRAGRFALGIYAYHEAAQSLRRALYLVKTLPDDAPRRQREFEMQLDLGNALMVLKGFPDPETQQAFDRSLELCDSTTPTTRLFETIWGLHQVYNYQGNTEKTLLASHQCWQMAQQLDDPELLLQAHHALWAPYTYSLAGPRGLLSVLEHTQKGIELYRPEWHHSHVQRFGNHDPGVCARFIQSNALWLLGYPDQAAFWTDEAISLATVLGHPFTLLIAMGQGAKIYGIRGEYQQSLEIWDRRDPIVLEHNLPRIGGEDYVWRGWAMAQISPSRAAVDLMEQGIARLKQLGWMINQSVMASMLAESYLKLGEVVPALKAIEEGLAIVTATREANYRPELFRVRAECFRALNNLTAAEDSYRQALRLAQQQQAKSLELRAAMGLSQLWVEQGKRFPAYELLSEVYNWFTEGFDTTDLRQAKELLQSLQ